MVRSSSEWVWWKERVRGPLSAVASWTDPAPVSSNNDVRPARYPVFDSDSGLNWRAKPASTYEPTQMTTRLKNSFATPCGGRGLTHLKARWVELIPPPQVGIN